jgi:membrane protein DedA with SNARE-associated domain
MTLLSLLTPTLATQTATAEAATSNNPLVQLVEAVFLLVLGLIHGTIERLGYLGVILLMAVESANVPLPSEMILPYAGYLVQQGHMNLHLVALAGAVGCVLGSVPSYFLGYYGGRKFLARYGKWLLLSEHDLDKAEGWVQRFGDWAFFLCRMLPIVRTFISLPAGILKARFWQFVFFTFIGSWVWSYGLAYAGLVLGENLEAFKHFWHQFDLVIALVILGLGAWYVWHHLQGFRQKSDHTSD